MRKVYIVTLLAVIAIVCLQAVYIQEVYTNYIAKILYESDKAIKEALTDELRERNHPKADSKDIKNYSMRPLSSMSSRERDSLIRVCPPDQPENTINIDSFRDRNMGKTEMDIMIQLLQDNSLSEGRPFNLSLFDKVFNHELKKQFNNRFLLLDKNKVVIDSIGAQHLSSV